MSDTTQRASALLGQNVRVKLDEREIATGKLLSWSDGGEVVLVDEMGFVHHCWPMLDIEAHDE